MLTLQEETILWKAEGTSNGGDDLLRSLAKGSMLINGERLRAPGVHRGRWTRAPSVDLTGVMRQEGGGSSLTPWGRGRGSSLRM